METKDNWIGVSKNHLERRDKESKRKGDRNQQDDVDKPAAYEGLDNQREISWDGWNQRFQKIFMPNN